jgi:hypothetical protein
MDSLQHSRISADGQALRAKSKTLQMLCAEVRRQSLEVIAETKIAVVRSRAELARSRARRASSMSSAAA